MGRPCAISCGQRYELGRLSGPRATTLEDAPGKFFGRIVGEYDAIIERLVSPYPEMVWTLLYYLPDTYQPNRILELGCGTGNLTKVLQEKWPTAQILAVDVSEAMLEKAVARVNSPNLKTMHSTFENLSFDPDSFDFVTSSLALHHLPERDYRRLLANAFGWLSRGGFFSILDCVRARSDRLYFKAEQHWIELAEAHGIARDEMDEQITHHRRHDHYPILVDLPGWLESAGFADPEILWRSSIWAVVQAQKPT